jgi:anti-sigma regulatory factor (Ser/Thr protein kinase)
MITAITMITKMIVPMIPKPSAASIFDSSPVVDPDVGRLLPLPYPGGELAIPFAQMALGGPPARTGRRGVDPWEMGKNPYMTFGGFRHEATFYQGLHSLVDRVVPFISEQLASGATVLVMADPEQTDAIRDVLPEPPASLRFAGVESLGSNPARLIPRWTDFVADAPASRPLIGVGALRYGRTAAEQLEFELHEALLNVAFAHGVGWRLVCPFDTSAAPDVRPEAQRTHPSVLDGQRVMESPTYLGLGAAALTLREPLPKAPAGAVELSFERADLPEVRSFLRDQMSDIGLAPRRVDDLLLASHEAATNSLRHGGGAGRIQVWRDDSWLICDVAGNGLITDPLVGRRRPDARRGGGLGLWIVNQLCDLVQLRSGPGGTEVRMHMLLTA